MATGEIYPGSKQFQEQPGLPLGGTTDEASKAKLVASTAAQKLGEAAQITETQSFTIQPSGEQTPAYSWWDGLSLTANYVGSGLYTFGYDYVIPSLVSFGSAATWDVYTLACAYYSQGSLPEATAETVCNHIEEPGFCKKAMDESKAKLKSPGCEKLSKNVALFAMDFIHHELVDAPELDPTLRISFVQDYLLQKSDETGEIDFSFLGEVACHVLDKKGAVLEEAIEANMLMAFSHCVDHFRKLQKNDPYVLVDFFKEILDNTRNELEEIQTAEPPPTDEELKEKEKIAKAIFVKHFIEQFMKIALPNGASDLLNPVPLFSKQMLHTFLKSKVLPKIFGKIEDKFTDERTKNKLILKSLQAIHHFVETPTVPKVEKHKEKSHLKPYEHQQEFNQSLSDTVLAMVSLFLPEELAAANFFVDLEKLIQKAGPKVVETIAHIDLAEAVNKGAGGIAPLLEPVDQPFTVKEKEALREEKKINDEAVKKEIEKEAQWLLDNPKIVRKKVVEVIARERPEEVKETTYLLSALSRQFKKLFASLAAGFVNVLGKTPVVKRIYHKAVARTHQKAKEAKPSTLVRAVKGAFKTKTK